MLKVNFEELEFDPVCQVVTATASYQGKPFTGTACLKDMEHDEYGEYLYLNGNAHGRWFFFNTKNNNLISEEFYEDGVHIGEHRTWFENGKIKKIIRYENGEIVFSQEWNRDEILIVEIDNFKQIEREWYDNGQIFRLVEKTTKPDINRVEKFFHENGELLMEIKCPNNGEDKFYFFNNEFIYSQYDLLNSQHYQILQSFFQQTLKSSNTPAAEFIQLLCRLTCHPEPFFRYEAARMLGDLKSRESIKYLEKLLMDTAKPVLYDRYGFLKMSTLWSVGDMAKKALELIYHEKDDYII